MATAHTWKLFRAGGFDQVLLSSGADLLALDSLDQKLWVALSCPTSGLEFDEKTLALIDTDHDGRIRAPELIAAAKWAGGLLKDPDELVKGSASLRLEAIDDATPEGRELLSLARRVLEKLGRADDPEISVEDAAETMKMFAELPWNGDGIVPPESAESAGEEAAARVIREIVDCVGGAGDRGGKPGVGKEQLEKFFAEARAASDWWKKADEDAAIRPLGEATGAAAELVRSLATKIDDYFARCRLAAFDARAEAALNRSPEDYAAFAARDLSVGAAEISALPLARVEARRPLPLGEGVNPAFAGALSKLATEVVAPLLGERDRLTEAEWTELRARFAPHEAWLAAKAGASVEKLGAARVREILDGGFEEKIGALLERDAALEPQLNAIASLDKLVRLHRDLYALANNFVAFHDFYGRRKKAIFQAGTLYLDQRSCELCVRVDDPKKHAVLAGYSRAYLAYCDLERRSDGAKMSIAAAVTNGDSDNLMVGRNGLFYDRKGRDWDATVTRIIDNPISMRQAFVAPYKRLARFIETQIEKFAAAKDKEAGASLEAGTKEATDAKAGEKPGAFDVAKFAGIFAAIGLAIGAIGGALGALFTAFARLAWWQMPLAVAGILLVVSGPSMLLAWLKLRQRNLGPLLDANGWAINTRARVNLPFGAALTRLAVAPAGSRRELRDPYADPKGGRRWAAAAAALIVGLGGLWYFGRLKAAAPWLPDSPYTRASSLATPPAAAPASHSK